MSTRVLFFGVRAGDDAGHYLNASNGYIPERDLKSELPTALHRIDSVWCYPTPRTAEQVGNPQHGRDETQGRGFIHYVDGWTVIAWWDRSADKRGGCNANFIVRGRHQWEQAIEHARAAFPREMARMDAAYSVHLAGADLPPDDNATAAEAFALTFRDLHPDVQARVLRILSRRQEPTQ